MKKNSCHISSIILHIDRLELQSPFPVTPTGSKPLKLTGDISAGPIMAKEGISDGTTQRVAEDSKPDHIEDLSLEDLLERKLTGALNEVDAGLEFNCGLFRDVISIVERILIRMALKKTNHVQVAAAQFLGINRNTLRKKIKELKIKMP